MTCSYKRTKRGQKRDWLPEISTYCESHGHRWFHDWKETKQKYKEEKAWVAKNPHRVKDVDDFFVLDYAKSPSWHNHDFHTVPRRRIERDLLKKVLKDDIDPDDAAWPDGKKPVNYYW